MKEGQAKAIQRLDYSAPAFWIDSVDLTFDLDPAKTRVLNRMQVRRNPAVAPQSLRLHGEDLNLARVLVNGAGTSFKIEEGELVLENLPEGDEPFALEIFTTCAPAKNTQLSGLYVSQGTFFTQCEAEGFRRITYFLDRPDVMASYQVLLRASKADYPVLLSNGNLVESGELEAAQVGTQGDAAQVHVRLWLDEPHARVANQAFGDQRVSFLAPGGETPNVGEVVECPPADVVTRAVVLSPRIPEADDDLHLQGRCGPKGYFFASASSSAFALRMSSGSAPVASPVAAVPSSLAFDALTVSTVSPPPLSTSTPAGIVRSLTWTDPPTLMLVTSTSMRLGMFAGSTRHSSSCVTCVRMPALRRTPMDVPVITIGMLTVTNSPATSSWKSTWMMARLTGWRWMSRMSVRDMVPSTASSMTVVSAETRSSRRLSSRASTERACDARAWP